MKIKHNKIEIDSELINYIRSIEFDTYKELIDFTKELYDLHFKFDRISVRDVWDMVDLLGFDYMKNYGWEDTTSFESISNGEDVFKIIFKEPDLINMSNREKRYESKDISVSEPQHYKTSKGIETIDVIEAFTEGLQGIEASDTANILKYACRWKKKNGIQDIEKLIWYATHLVNYLKDKESK